MNRYEQTAAQALQQWQKKMRRKPGWLDQLSKRAQVKMNSYIPEKVHAAITIAVKQMIRSVLFGARYITGKPLRGLDLESREFAAEKRIRAYQTTAAVEGGLTGAAGILVGLTDFPLLLGIKIKLLFDLAAIYGYDVKDYKERLYLLHIFQLAFSSRAHQRAIYQHIADWNTTADTLPEDINQLDWRTLQQEYRDYLDIAKMAQLVPIIGAPVGAVVNYRLIRKLGDTAKNAYRLRYFNSQQPVALKS